MSVACAVLAILLDGFFLQGIAVPVRLASGSMAPRLPGPHRRIHCPSCGFCFAIDALPPLRRVHPHCPRCGDRSASAVAAKPRPGRRLLVDRITPRLFGWRRWQVIVFRHPDQAEQCAVKRLIGLPGERVQIIDGDVYVNGSIQRKDLLEQRRLAQHVYQLDARTPYGVSTIRWSTEKTPSGWKLSDGRCHYLASETPTRGMNDFDWLTYRNQPETVVHDGVAYNAAESRTLHSVVDLMISSRVTVHRPGRLHFVGRGGSQELHAMLPLAGGTAWLRAGDRVVHECQVVPLVGSRPVRLEFSLFDAQVLLAVNGRTILKWPCPHPLQPRETNGNHPVAPASPLAIACEDAELTLDELTVWRDVYYTAPRHSQRACRSPHRIGPREVFVLGDNSPISDDSRTWHGSGGVAWELIVGRPLGGW